MTSSPITSDDRQPREWSIAGRTLILSAADHRALAVLNGGDPLLLPPGSVLQFGDPPGELVVTRIRVILGEDGAVVCAETEPAPQADLRRSSAAPARPAPPPGHLRPVPAQIPWSQVRPGNGLCRIGPGTDQAEQPDRRPVPRIAAIILDGPFARPRNQENGPGGRQDLGAGQYVS